MYKTDQRHLRLAQSCSASKQDSFPGLLTINSDFPDTALSDGGFYWSLWTEAWVSKQLTHCRAICAAGLADLGYLTSWSLLLLWGCRSRVQKNLNLDRTKVSALINLQPNLAERQRSSLGKYWIKCQHGSDELHQITSLGLGFFTAMGDRWVRSNW